MEHQFVKYRGAAEYGDRHGIGRVTRFQNGRVYVVWPEYGDSVYGLNLGHVEFVDRPAVGRYIDYLKAKYGFAAVPMILSLFDLDTATEEGADLQISLCEELAA